jgi:hypothetical protein
VIWGSGRFPNDEFWRDGKFFWVILEALHALEKDACRGFTHIVQWLANSGEPRVVIARNVNVVESDDGDVFRYAQIRIAQSANRTDGRDVIERYERGEFAPVLQKLLDNGVAKLRRSQIALELDSEIRRNFENEITSDGNDAAPTIIRIGTERLPANERDVTMTQLMQSVGARVWLHPPQGDSAGTRWRFASERALGASGNWFCGFSTLRGRRAFDLGAALKGRIRAAFEGLAISGMGRQLFRPTGVYFALYMLGPMSVKRGNGS